ncbi:MAG: HAD family hydrolase [Fimbriimonadaceae bacterium]|nr:HAD family hydrolase [Fimbriimonadaceae bacterium]
MTKGGARMQPFEAVLFDVDGTLWDSLPAVTPGIADIVEQFAGIRPSDASIHAYIGIPLRDQLPLYPGVPDDAAVVERMCSLATERFERYAHLERPFSATIAALEWVHRAGIKTALVTSKSRPELEFFLPRFSASRYVDAIVSASDVPRPKPAPDSALLACQRLGVSPDRAVMIGDSVYDLRCAKAAGVVAVAVTYGAGQPDALHAEQPDFILPTPETVFEWVQHQLTPDLCLARK